MASKEDHNLSYNLLKLLEKNPDINQRQLAHELGLSLGKINYCLQAMIAKGLVKAKNFKNHNNKLAYTYFLTPPGIEEKVRLTFEYFRHVEAQYETLSREIETLRERNPDDVSSSVKDTEAGVRS